jgi:hypothetical protein
MSQYLARMLAISKQLEAQGVSHHASAPWLYRLAWRIGIHLKPPLYQSFRRRVFSYALPFTAVFFLGLELSPYPSNNPSIAEELIAAAFTGFIMGLGMAYTIDRPHNIKLPPLDRDQPRDN